MSDTADAPMPEVVRRVEIFTGAGRRRKWSAEEKSAIIAESRREGETVSAVARRYGLTSSQLFWWRRDERERARRAGKNDFATVMVEPRLPASAECSRAWSIEIVLGSALVRVRDGTDGATLSAALSALKQMA